MNKRDERAIKDRLTRKFVGEWMSNIYLGMTHDEAVIAFAKDLRALADLVDPPSVSTVASMLLHCLKEMVGLWESTHDEDDLVGRSVLVKARAAIAKAGQSRMETTMTLTVLYSDPMGFRRTVVISLTDEQSECLQPKPEESIEECCLGSVEIRMDGEH